MVAITCYFTSPAFILGDFFSFCSLHKAKTFLFYRYFHTIFPSFINSANLSLLIRNRTKPRQQILNSLLLFLTEKVVLNMFQEFKGFCVMLFRFVVCVLGFFLCVSIQEIMFSHSYLFLTLIQIHWSLCKKV